MDQISTLLGTLITAVTILGWIFKVWIINPLSLAIAALDRNLIKMDAALDKMRDQSIVVQTDIARIDSSAKSAHNRIDDISDRVSDIEKELRG